MFRLNGDFYTRSVTLQLPGHTENLGKYTDNNNLYGSCNPIDKSHLDLNKYFMLVLGIMISCIVMIKSRTVRTRDTPTPKLCQLQ